MLSCPPELVSLQAVVVVADCWWQSDEVGFVGGLGVGTPAGPSSNHHRRSRVEGAIVVVVSIFISVGERAF